MTIYWLHDSWVGNYFSTISHEEVHWSCCASLCLCLEDDGVTGLATLSATLLAGLPVSGLLLVPSPAAGLKAAFSSAAEHWLSGLSFPACFSSAGWPTDPATAARESWFWLAVLWPPVTGQFWDAGRASAAEDSTAPSCCTSPLVWKEWEQTKTI